jgi:hypothetical protein
VAAEQPAAVVAVEALPAVVAAQVVVAADRRRALPVVAVRAKAAAHAPAARAALRALEEAEEAVAVPAADAAAPVRAAVKADAAAPKAVLKVGADSKRQGAGKGLAVSVAEVVGRGAAKIANVLDSLTGKSGKRRSG